MADNHIGAVLVSDPRGLAGIVTDRDLALAVLGHGLKPYRHIPVGDHVGGGRSLRHRRRSSRKWRG